MKFYLSGLMLMDKNTQINHETASNTGSLGGHPIRARETSYWVEKQLHNVNCFKTFE